MPFGGIFGRPLDNCRLCRQNVAMPTRKTLTPDAILVALRATDEDVEAAAALLNVNVRTLQRRMAEVGIRARIRYELAQEAA